MNRLTTLTCCLIAMIAGLSCAAPAPAEAIVIAHRGASGYLPEHTLEAYALAHGMGADFIEPDLVMTKDAVLICLHDIHLEATTDVEDKFPGARRADGKWYAADLTFAEIEQLNVHERIDGRFPKSASRFSVPTFSQMIELVQGLNRTTGRNVGIYPELKAPAWHAENGLPLEEAALRVLTAHGYTRRDHRVYVQCFEPDALKKIRFDLKSDLPLIQLIGNGRSASKLFSREGLHRIADYADGIGPAKSLIADNPRLVAEARTIGLQVHPYTFRADQVPPEYRSYEAELEAFLKWGIDGLFTDFPDTTAAFLASFKE